MALSPLYKEALLDALRDELRVAGFKKRGVVFHRVSADVVHLIALQSSIDSPGQIPQLTINLALWCKPLAARGTEPSVIAAVWRCRLGDVLPTKTDLWWTVPDKASLPKVARGMLADLKAHGIPALDLLPDSAALFALWRGGQSPGLAASEAQRYLAALANQPS